jgi:hypothetical protein
MRDLRVFPESILEDFDIDLKTVAMGTVNFGAALSPLAKKLSI